MQQELARATDPQIVPLIEVRCSSTGTPMQGGFSPLTVKWADPNLTEKKRKAAEVEEPRSSNDNNTQVGPHYL